MLSLNDCTYELNSSLVFYAKHKTYHVEKLKELVKLNHYDTWNF